VIQFQCGHCGKKLKVSGTRAGKTGRCPSCGSAVFVPREQTPVAAPPQDVPPPTAPPGVSGLDPALFDIPQKVATSPEAPSRCHGVAQDSPEPAEPQPAAAETESRDDSGPPWFVDMFLYPLNLSGLLHLVGLWLLLFFLCPHVVALGLGTEFVPLVYALPVAYVLYYFAECIRDRAGGARHVPEYWMDPSEPNKWGCVTQAFEVVGCVAVCFCPVSIYYVVREQVDWLYWLLLASGGLLFPMVLLAVVLFDSFDGLNPIRIGRSIFRTFVPYCVLVLLLSGGALLSVTIGFPLNGFHPLPLLPFLLWLVQFYLVFVAIALLGGFYQRHESKLDWEV